nr:MAG TPA: hypothetical protein [Caudoviricetes sp.]
MVALSKKIIIGVKSVNLLIYCKYRINIGDL